MSHVMLEAVIRMPYKMAMHSEISRRQFYDRANQALDEMEAYANARVKQALKEAISADGATARPVTKSASEQEGWVLVPVTPTPEMLQAGYWSGSGDVSVNQAWARKEVWARMIGSAPKPDE